jgi:hypothetical protein
MKLPSIQDSLRDARATMVRFPLVMADAAVGTIAALILADHEGPPQASVLFNILLAAILGIPFLSALTLAAEKKGWTRGKTLALGFIGLLLLAAYGTTVPSDLLEAPADTIIRFFLIATGMHCVVAVAPFMTRGEANGFWNYNKALFVRLLTALLFAFILWAGLAIALAALKNLFGFDIPGKRDFELWILISGIFMTWFFLAGVTRDLARLEFVTEYPRGLKVFAQYILVPLVLVYLVILYAYMGKIIIAWDWPQGWVSKLILGFSGTGILSLLLLQPIKGREDNFWIGTVSKWFYVVLIPLVAMLFLAVWRRVSEYGVTPGRYLAIALGFWLAGLVIYFLASKAKSLKAIPLTLCIVAFAVSVGPWGMLHVSERSQVNRFRSIAGRSGIVVDGKIRAAHGKLFSRDVNQLFSIVGYLHEIHGYGGIQELFTGSLRKDTTGAGNAWKDVSAVTEMMGIWGRGDAAGRPIVLNAITAGITEITGYDHMMHVPHLFQVHARLISSLDTVTYRLGDSSHAMILSFMHGSTHVAGVVIEVRPVVGPILRGYADTSFSRIPQEKMAASLESDGVRVKVQFSEIDLEIQGMDTTVSSCSADVFYTLKSGK